MIHRDDMTCYISEVDLCSLLGVAHKTLEGEFNSLILSNALTEKDKVMKENIVWEAGRYQFIERVHFTLDATLALGYRLSPLATRSFREWFENQQRAAQESAAQNFMAFYQDSEGNPELHESYVVFADLLGYKDLILKTSDQETTKLLARLQSAFENASVHIFDEESEWRRLQARYFSDCVSLITPIRWDLDQWAESSFGAIVVPLKSWQLSLVLDGFFIRGGFAQEQVFTDSFSIFGKAHLEAYVLESERAIYPRIILSERALAFIKKQMDYYSKEIDTPHETSLLVDIDGEVFVNYLAALWNNPLDFPENALEIHRNLVKDTLSKPSSDNVYAKYQWVAKYHNWFCSHAYSQTLGGPALMLEGPVGEFRNVRTYLNSLSK
jgi:hypothetical protein